jgi:EAL domain-containing protein (putative c-di-GMP-specific phosphodiesterase class I)
MQGYFFSRPLPADELSKFLDNLGEIYRERLP